MNHEFGAVARSARMIRIVGCGRIGVSLLLRMAASNGVLLRTAVVVVARRIEGVNVVCCCYNEDGDGIHVVVGVDLG